MSSKNLPLLPEELPNNQIPVLVVDDSQDNLDLMEALLVSEGFATVYLTSSGPEALAFLETHFDVGVVLLDMMMPGMDGYEVCRRITGSRDWGHIPVIIVTGGALRHNEALQKSFEAGAIDFVTKPVNEVELLMRVHSALSLYRERVIRCHKTRELIESEEKFRVTFDQAPVGIAHVNPEGHLLLTNRRLCEMLGYTSAELMGLNFEDLCDVSNREAHNANLKNLEEEDVEVRVYELTLLDKASKRVWTHVTVSPLRDVSGKLKYFIYVVEDITEHKDSEENLRLAATVFDSSMEGIIITDADSRIVKVNNAFTAITGYAMEEVVHKTPHFLSSGRQEPSFYESIWSVLEKTGQWQGEVWNRRKSGEIYPAWVTLCAVRDSSSKITNYVEISRDITIRKEAEMRLSYLANHDALTGLPNRILFNDRLMHALDQARRYGDPLAILFLDLDRFKIINDTLGHDVGDALLQAVVKRLIVSARKSDTIARWGGDEFVLLLEKPKMTQGAAAVAKRILGILSEPFVLGGTEVFVSASIGISIYPKDGEDPQTLLRNADAAMYRVKDRGRNNYEFYTAAMNATALERLRLESDLRHALERNEFLLYFQPKVDIGTGRISGAEALVRWQHPKRGLLMPKDFIPLAEESGLIVSIGEWVLKAACAQSRAWLDEGMAPVRVAVNLSNHHFRKDKLVAIVDRILKETGLDSDLLELEITESVMMEDMERAISTLYDLTGLGVHIAVDDFGTGYCSLGYLKRFPIETLKIDRSFVQHIPDDLGDTAIAEAIISLGHTLKLKVIAEGVETQEQLSFLRQRECDEAQGYLFSVPLPPKEFASLLIRTDPHGFADLAEGKAQAAM